ncbi:hypothetical protein MMYC01_201518 [Madurella mycetomatis]|uniref:F-box domain-containing protein n=1 Tax=Madurella mycetomatis TaxID=100816 RepID=A0A175WEB5_9PEZI|nr:hypothetical protein MMYC01_201518 [Madurella mycetomatis]
MPTRNTRRRRASASEREADIPLVNDLTESLEPRSKRTERRRRKLGRKVKDSAATEPRGFLDLPYEILMTILIILRPSDIFALSSVSRPLRTFILEEQGSICKCVIDLRYSTIERCFLRPVLMKDLDPSVCAILQNPGRTELLAARRRPYQHIQSPDASFICTCLTCLPRWNFLCIVVDFAYWQDNLDNGEPIPMVSRGTFPAWNQDLLTRNARIVVKSLTSPLWYARVLEAHLDSTTRSIRRHGQNKGNKRRRFRMTDEDVRAGTDTFLERGGPPTVEFPYHRDNYYMLEAFLPNRSWLTEEQRWAYLPAEQHDKDVEIAVRWDAIRKQQDQQDEPAQPEGARAVLVQPRALENC